MLPNFQQRMTLNPAAPLLLAVNGLPLPSVANS